MTKQQIWVILLRHFDSELKLLEELSPAVTELYHAINGEQPTENRRSQLAKVEELVQRYRQVSSELVKSRDVLIHQANQLCVAANEIKTMSQIIRQFPQDQRQQLESKREAVNREIQAVKTTIASITAVAFYDFEFHRRFVFELCRHDENKTTYGPDGSSSRLPQGRIYGRTC